MNHDHHDHTLDHHAPHDHDRGLAHDLQVLQRTQVARRRALLWLAGAGTLSLLGCGGNGDDSDGVSNPGSTASGTGTATGSTGTNTSTGTSTGSTTTSACSVIPEETAGPYPGDGSNQANGTVADVLRLSGVVRGDIRSSFAGASGTAAGVPMTVTLRLVNVRNACADLAGYAIYLWHCDRDGNYSMYSSGVTAQNYLRGVQETGSDGTVTFTTIFPGCYAGRMPHMHFEVYRSLNTATSYSNKLRTSQLALPTEVCRAVYSAAPGYSSSAVNLNRISFATDNVFSDGVTSQLASVDGDVDQGYAATLTVGISV